jgi:hypothetical protein
MVRFGPKSRGAFSAMKRDMELVRSILLATEANPNPEEELDPLEVEGFSEVMVFHHVQLLAEAGYLRAHERQAIGIYAWYPISLTWTGHDFLDSIRDPEIWKETKAGVAKVGGWTADTIKAIALGYIKLKAKDVLGIDL